MLAAITKRAASSLPILFLVTLFAFLLIKAIPGDPVAVLLGDAERDYTQAQVKQLSSELGLDQPWPRQYAAWVSGWVAGGELGRSYRDGRPVRQVIAERLSNTLLLVSVSIVLSISLGLGWGLLLAILRSSKRALARLAGSILSALVLFFYSAPSFWVAFLVIYAVEAWVPNWPVLGLHSPGISFSASDVLRHLLLPALLLSSRKIAKIAFYMKAMLEEQVREDYVLVARAKGLSSIAVMVRHVLRNSLLPVIALVGLSLPTLFGGSVLIETVFGIAGMGRLAVEATYGRNYPLLMSLIVIYGFCVVGANLLADIVSAWVDPRLMEEWQAAVPGSGSGHARRGAA